MRTLLGFAVFSAVLLLQGCTALATGYAADVNRQRRSEATISLTGPPPAIGDSLVALLADSTEVRGALTRLSADSLVIGAAAVPLAAVRRVERPWVRKSVGKASLVGLLIDVVLINFWFRDASWN